MNRQTILLSLFVLITLAACHGNREHKEDNPEGSDSAIDHPAAVTDGSFYSRYEGAIGGKPVVMHISKFSDEISANYNHDGQVGYTLLYRDRDTVLLRDSISLFEVSDYGGGDAALQPDPRWHVLVTAETVQGERISGDRKNRYRIDLKKSFPPRSSAFDVIGFQNIYRFTGLKNETPEARTSVMMLEPSLRDVDGQWFNRIVNSTVFGAGYESLNVTQVVKKWGTAFIDSYRDEMDSLKPLLLADTASHHVLNYEQIMNTNLTYNNNGYVVLQVMGYAYQGGAHGMYGTTMICFDMQEKKKMELADIVTADSLTLKSLLEKHFRIQRNLRPQESLNSTLFENDLPPNRNFYFTQKGLGFSYQPYEVAAYAFGEIRVVIPYTDLKQWLNPVFRKRMNLR